MRLIFDVNHPGHVHLFKNCIWELQKKGHEVLITASEKDVTFKLLDNYGLDYVSLGNYGNTVLQKFLNIPIMDLKMYREIKNFNPDIVIGLSSIRGAHAAKIARTKCIIFDDTEHSKYEHLLYVPFANKILTPSCFTKDLGKKQIRYEGYHELAYLHPNNFNPNPEVLGEIGLTEGDPFIILRFVSWNASHDVGHRGIQNKVELVHKLEKYGRVLITSEGELDDGLEKYQIKVSPEKMHDLLYYASLYIGEGATMASECAVLGTPSIYVSSLVETMGNFIELGGKYGLIFNYSSSDKVLDKAIELIQRKNLKQDWKTKRDVLLADKIDVTNFMVDFIEKYATPSNNKNTYEV